MLDKYPLFDSHLHIIDKKFPLYNNNGYLPEAFSCENYLQRLSPYQLHGGAIVSGSFQKFDQSYLIEALANLGDSYVGVTQLPVSVSDDEILYLHTQGVRAIRFNLKRGEPETVKNLSLMASRVYELCNWHVELYADADQIENLFQLLITLPAVSIDHLGLNKSGESRLCKLAEHDIKIKASGFGRVDFNITPVLKSINAANPNTLMFGTDLPSTRAPRAYKDHDYILVADMLDTEAAHKIFYENAMSLYKPSAKGLEK